QRSAGIEDDIGLSVVLDRVADDGALVRAARLDDGHRLAVDVLQVAKGRRNPFFPIHPGLHRALGTSPDLQRRPRGTAQQTLALEDRPSRADRSLPLAEEAPAFRDRLGEGTRATHRANR